MTSPDDDREQQTVTPSKGGSILLQSIFAGIVAGTGANILALSLGHSIWVGLLSHSVFGALAMGLVLALCAGREEPTTRKTTAKTLSSGVRTARH